MTLEFVPSDFNSTISDDDFRKSVIGLVNEVLRERFQGDSEKQRPYPREGRYNFACPYCGDSAKDSHKKRANIYYNGYAYKCYNCGKHTTIETFLEDFGKEISQREKVYARNQHSESIAKYSSVEKTTDISFFIDPTILEKYALPKEQIISHYNLTPINNPSNSWIRKYLNERHQLSHEIFAWDNEKTRLFIFNQTKNGNVLGFQVRNFKSEPKYVTHTLEMIYKKMELPIPNDPLFVESSKLSFTFGLFDVDFSQMITITEGPLDSFLIRNCMSTCGIDNDFPFDIKNKRYMYDYDEPGIKAALEKISQGESVFLWKKYINKVGINIYKKKLDYTDLVTISKKTRVNLLPIDGFFSESKWDSYDL